MEIKVWILVAAVGVMGTALGFTFKVAINMLIKRLDVIADELKRLNLSNSMHGQDISHLQETNSQFQQRLNNHADRIRALEIHPAKTQSNEL